MLILVDDRPKIGYNSNLSLNNGVTPARCITGTKKRILVNANPKWPTDGIPSISLLPKAGRNKFVTVVSVKPTEYRQWTRSSAY